MADAQEAKRKIAYDSGLYVAATPIGNLGDVSERLKECLAAADLILCEDTRRTRKLLSALHIHRPTRAYHEHNARRLRPGILKRLKEGAVIVLVSDAGTPLVSDPGHDLVRAVIEAGLTLHHIPGPSAVIAALVLSGLPANRFLFEGFLPQKQGRRRRALKALSHLDATLVCFESPRRLAATLKDMAAIFGPGRDAAVLREMTKLFEEVRRANLGELAATVAEEPAPKGEVTIVIGPPGKEDIAHPAGESALSMEDRLGQLLAKHSVKEAAAILAGETGMPRRAAYAAALRLKRARETS